ncbi:MAG: bifunctional nuclease family protein [Tannerellaceae bacterium]|nr:bifunctional nuclease family protein [Tannerellaceae bacterium]
MDAKIKLRIQGLTSNQRQSNTYALVLAEEGGQKRIPIIVGMAEAQSIAIALEHITPPRPLTHDLFHSFFKAFGVHLLEVYIYKFEDGVFFSELVFERDGQETRIDSRTSDAIAIALRANCDIYMAETVAHDCSIEMDDAVTDPDDEDSFHTMGPENIKDDDQLKKWLSMLDDESLQSRFEEAVANEFYEYAKMYRDELRRRETKGGGKKDD